MRTFYRTTDGHAYFLGADGELMGAPTFADGSVAFDSAGYVNDFVTPPPDEERRFILQYLNGE
jgi:hypothetical protein